MSGIRDIPEVQALDARHQLIRIPDELDVPITPRVRRLIDTVEFRRLADISQLGLVALVYPAAHHSRFEHSLGVYRMALLYLKQLSYDETFAQMVTAQDAQLFIAAALLHDIGHWPFCHPIEDIRLADVPNHEEFARQFLSSGELAEHLGQDWHVSTDAVLNLLTGIPGTPAERILSSLLSGPIDIDKMDYLVRDSLHAGVPYGRNFDQQRLIGSLCLNQRGEGLAITEKGRTAAEMMVFARYVMFSEVYWHHAVRSATAMLQRAFYLLCEQMDLANVFRMTEPPMIGEMQQLAKDQPAGELLNGLFGPRRQLYKRLAQFSVFQQRDLYEPLARRPYTWLVDSGQQFARQLSKQLGQPVAPHELLIDAPPVKRELDVDVEIRFPKEDKYRRLRDVSPIVRTLSAEQFDDYVKRVRIFIHPRHQAAVQDLPDVPALVRAAVEESLAISDRS